MTENRLKELFAAMAGHRILVIGDVMLDRYLIGRTDRRSPEADVDILDHESTSTKLGGAANVALNFKSLGNDVMVISTTGKDDAKKELSRLLDEEAIQYSLIDCQDRPTTVKTRILSGNQHLLRVDFESTKAISEEVQSRVLNEIDRCIEEFKPEVAVFQDYNKGLLTRGVIEQAILKLKAHDIYIAVDPKIDNFWAYIGVNLFKPNLRETSIALDQKVETSEQWDLAVSELRERLEADVVALTLSEHGIVIGSATNTLHHEVLKVEIVDVCGAGDAVLSALTMLLFTGKSFSDVAYVGNLVGGFVCGFSGVAYIAPDMIFDFYKSLQ